MRHSIIAWLCALAACVAACDTPEEQQQVEAPATEQVGTQEGQPPAVEEPAEQQRTAKDLVGDATTTLKEMKSDAELEKLLTQSKGVFIVPEYGRAAAGVGARGGQGVLLAQMNGKWSGPVFYDIGGISVGAQLGAEGGEIAMLLMSEQALNSFMGDNTFSLNAGAKLTLVDYSALDQATLGKGVGDVIFWSGTEGAFAGATLSATNISWDDEENPAYYGKPVTAQEVLTGKVSPPTSGELQEELSRL